MPKQGFGGELFAVGEVEKGGEGFGGIDRVKEDAFSLGESHLSLDAVGGRDTVAGADEVEGEVNLGFWDWG